MLDKKRALNTFKEYVSNYNSKEEKVRLKIEHTLRVTSFCEEIAKSLNLSEEDCDIAWLCGLLHDVGRFEQLRRFHTFKDADSIDHATLSCEILFDDGKIRDYTEISSYDSLIRTAIAHHSLFKIPGDLTEREKMFANILRDADKIDIFRVNVDFALEDIYDVTTEELKNSVVSDGVMQSIYEEHSVLRSLEKTPIDNLVAHIALIFELVFPYSLKTAVEQGYVQDMLEFESDTEKGQEQFKEINRVVYEFIEKRLN